MDFINTLQNVLINTSVDRHCSLASHIGGVLVSGAEVYIRNEEYCDVKASALAMAFRPWAIQRPHQGLAPEEESFLALFCLGR